MANALERLATEARDVGAFADGYFSRLKSILDRIDRNAVARLAQELEIARAEGATVFLVGNGGSATLASSMANDLGLDVVRKAGTQQPFRMFALTDNMAAITAIANDVGYEDAFVNQLRTLYRDGDRLIVVSASGNSPNVVNAARYVKGRGGRILGLLGFSGGVMLGMCDVTVHVPSEAGEYGPVEDVHLIVSHILAHWFQVRLRGQ